MRIIRLIVISLSAIALCLFGLFVFYVHAPAPAPPFSVQSGALKVGDRTRHYLFYVPEHTKELLPIVFVFHGSMQTARGIRTFTGYEFERLARDKGFIVVYPQGYKKNWNDCRSSASYPARTEKIDDTGLVRALTDHFVKNGHADPDSVFAVGYSNGGHFCFRLALDMPEQIAGIAAVSANVPTPDNTDCPGLTRPVPALIMNGTQDPLNPNEGGTVSFFGFGNRGTVRSSLESARFFASRDGYTEKGPVTMFSDHSVPVQVRQWNKDGKPRVILYSLMGGGHLIPQPVYRAPRFLGPNAPHFNGPEAIWAFFEKLL